jgi:hypothetical protein
MRNNLHLVVEIIVITECTLVKADIQETHSLIRVPWLCWLKIKINGGNLSMYDVDQYTVSLLHFEDGIKDECGNVWSIQNNGVSISQAQTKDGSGSAYFNAVGGIYTTTNSKFAFGTGDFTIDFWMYYIDGNYEANFGNVAVVLDGRNSLGTSLISIGIYSDYKIAFGVGGKVILSTPNVIKPNNWIHITCVRSAGIGHILVDDKSIIEGDLDYNLTQSIPLYIGGDGYPRSSIGAVKCYLDEFRISNTARWTLPSTPTQLTATAGDSQVSLSWNAVDGASSYNIKRSTTAGGPYTTIATNVSGTSYVDNTVTNGTTYYYVVTAVNGTAESANSNEAPATPIVSAPINLIAIAGNSQVTLSWGSVSTATGYNVKRSTTAGGPYAVIASNVSTNSYVDSTVTNGATYYYVVTALSGNSESMNSNEASATPQGQGLLRVTMSDSSEREYRLSTVEIENFIMWYDRTVGTGNTCYAFDDIVDLSKEYLSFEKIISFKVIPLKD